jgi:hypothetical protein
MKSTRLVAAAVVILMAPSAFAQTAPRPAPPARPGQVAQPAPAGPPAPRVSASPPQRGPQHVEKITRVIIVEDGVTLSIENASGDVVVSAGAPGELRLEAVKRARGTRETAQRQLEGTRVEVLERPGRVAIRTASDNPRSRVAVDYALVVPSSTAIEVRAISGDISVTGLRGEVRAETVRGSIRATGLHRAASLRAVVGDVRVDTSALEGDLTANSVSGSVILTGLTARSVTAGSVSGNVTLVDGAYERLQAQSINGNVELASALVRGGRYRVQSHAGNIIFVVGGATGFTLEANTFSGHLDSSRLQLKNANDPGHRGVESARLMRGVYGDGSAQVVISTFSGNVVITRK